MATTTRTATGAFIGHCTGGCGRVKVTEKFIKHSCGSAVVGCTPIKARTTEHRCGLKCTSALGPTCDCTCGGERHGEDHR